MNWINLIALRYFKSRKKDKFVNLTTKISIFAISFSIAMLILSFSVIRGFEEAILEKVLNEQGHLMIYDNGPYAPENVLKKIPKELTTMQIVETNAIISKNNQVEAMLVKGVEQKVLNKLKVIEEDNSNAQDLNEKVLPKIIIGFKFANLFGYKVGDTINLMIPLKAEPPFGIIPETIQCKVSKIVKFDLHELNRYGIFMEINEAKEMLSLENKVSKIICFGKNANDSLKYIPILEKLLPDKKIYSWKELNMLFADIMRVQKNMVSVILFAIIFLAAIACCAALILFINMRKKEISILRVLGAKKNDIIKIFLFLGMLISTFSSLIGLIFGLLISYNLDYIRKFVEYIFQTSLFDPEIYLLPAIPVSINIIDILLILSITFIITMFAALIPAYKTVSIDVLENL